MVYCPQSLCENELDVENDLKNELGLVQRPHSKHV